MYKVKVINNIEEIEQIRDFGGKIQWHPNSDIDFYLTVLNSRPDIIKPHVLLLTIDKSPKALLVGRIQDLQLPFRLGYKTVFT